MGVVKSFLEFHRISNLFLCRSAVKCLECYVPNLAQNFSEVCRSLYFLPWSLSKCEVSVGASYVMITLFKELNSGHFTTQFW